MNTPTRYRWIICSLLFAATTINYIDRQILSLLKPLLDAELHWTNEQFGWINSFFQGAYAISYLGFGWLIDKYGSKIGYAVSIAAWSLAALGHALVGSIPGFAVARVALGLGEGGNFPAAVKTVVQWFPLKERAFATTLFNSGSNVGALLAPAIIPWVALSYGWHSTFILAGLAGFVWLILWLNLAGAPRESKFTNPEEVALIESDAEPQTNDQPVSIPTLLRLKETWAFLMVKILTDPVWWFFLIWLPDYFKNSRGLDLKKMSLPLIIIYAIVTVLSIAGGWVSKKLIERGWGINKTRKVSLSVFALCVLPVVMATQVRIEVAVLLIGLAGAAHQAWSSTFFTLISDMYPRQAIASMMGLGGMVGSLSGMFFPVICGRILDHFQASGSSMGYTILFSYCGCAYLLAFGIHHLLVPRVAPLTIHSNQ